MSNWPDCSAAERRRDVDGDDELDLVEVRQLLTGDPVRATPVVLVALGDEAVAVARGVADELERSEADRCGRVAVGGQGGDLLGEERCTFRGGTGRRRATPATPG